MSKQRNRSLPQQLTLDHVSPATRLLEKRRHMFEVQEALDAQKEEFQRREATFKRREEMLKKKDLELQESLIKFNKFLQENDSKRNRAEKKQLDERKLKQNKEKEIFVLQHEVQRQLEKRAQMVEEVKKMSQYQGYLDGVLEVEEEYPEIQDLLMRYETLSAAREDLIKRQDSAADQNERERKELQDYMQETSDRMLSNNNIIADLQQTSESAAAQVVEIQEMADRQVATVAESTLQLGQVMMACENIYQRCMSMTHVARKEVKDGSSGDLQNDAEAIVEKLSFIRDYITDLQDITDPKRPGGPIPRMPKPAPGSVPFGPPGGDGGGAAASGKAGGAKVTDTASKVDYYKTQAVEGRQSARGTAQSRQSMSTGSES